MNTKIVLPINKNPYIHSNTSRTSLFAVLTSEEYAGRLNAVVSKLLITNGNRKYNGVSDKLDSNLVNIQIEEEQENGLINFYSHPYTANKNAYLYCEINSNERFSIETTIDYIQDSNADSFIKVVLCKGTFFNNEKDREIEFADELSVKLYSNGKLFLHTNANEMFLGTVESGSMPITIKVEKDSGLIIKYKYDKDDWIEVYNSKGYFNNVLQVGLYISPKINPFYYDFYTSHMQLCYTDRMKIAPHFDYYERYFSKLIPIRQIPMSMIDITDENIIEYFIGLIEKKYYINLGVDEYYIPGRLDYQKRHHMHVNFIYGFDREKGVFKLIGFDKFMKYSEIDFKSFYLAIQRDIENSSKINLYKYESKSGPTKFNIDATILVLKSYLNGENVFAISSSEVIVEDSNKPIIYGLNIHETICKNENHMSRFMRDIRIIYQIYEHNLIMKEMLDFINHIKLLSNENHKVLIEEYDEIIKTSAVIKNIILKNRMNPKEHTDVKVRDMMVELRDRESKAIKKLILFLEDKMAKQDK